MQKYLLDTDTCIYIIRKKFPDVIEKFNSLPFGSVAISSVTLAELQFGVAKIGHAEYLYTLVDVIPSRA